MLSFFARRLLFLWVRPHMGGARSAPVAQFQTDVSGSITGVRARQTLREGEAFGELLICEPAPLVDDERADL